VRSFPGPGDEEIVDMEVGKPFHVAVDRLRRVSSEVPSWSWRGLSLEDSANHAAASFTIQEGSLDFAPDGIDLSTLEPTPKQLIRLPLPDLRKRLDELQKGGDKQEMIEALNLDYVAPDFDSTRAEKLLTASPAEQRKMDPMEFLRAKIHLLHNDPLFHQLTSSSVRCNTYGPNAEKRDLRVGDRVTLGRYTFRLNELEKGGRRGYRMKLAYERVPSPLWLKRIVPRSIQRALRFRRSHERLVG
jgi:hypothetical protein